MNVPDLSGHDRTVDPVNQELIELRDRIGFMRFGLMTNQVWYQDPRRLVFTLARYKFVAKMLKGKARVVEIGCGDGFGARIVRQEVGHLLATDYDPLFIEDLKARMTPHLSYDAAVHDILAGPLPEPYDAAYSLDVMEHIPPDLEDRYLANIMASLTPQGVFVVGMPSLESQSHASPASKAGHVNCKSGEDFRNTLAARFHSVFVFSMNDEIVHTGFLPMAHYLLAVCVGPKA
ncbi:MAG TPA: class I SAM-dependent methyltransferase [Azospirillaceae bacterium]|nr:class I SAM-dependent methyltransferase [Azospirillaceae bacterium]